MFFEEGVFLFVKLDLTFQLLDLSCLPALPALHEHDTSDRNNDQHSVRSHFSRDGRLEIARLAQAPREINEAVAERVPSGKPVYAQAFIAKRRQTRHHFLARELLGAGKQGACVVDASESAAAYEPSVVSMCAPKQHLAQ